MPDGEYTPQQKFDHALAGGEAFEFDVRDWLNASYPQCWWFKVDTGGRWPYYDLYCKHCGRSVECYTDFYALKTGNEFFERNKLHATTADYIAVNNGYGIFVYRTGELLEWLRRMAKDPNCKWVKIRTKAGDGGRQVGITCWLKMWLGIGNMRGFYGPPYRILDTDNPRNTDLLLWHPVEKEQPQGCDCKGCQDYAQRPVDNKPPDD